MIINRNNYESWFLLYADGELSQANKQAVDAFVLLHPDLKEELDMLLETVLDLPANISMPGKNALLKPELWEEENISASQTQLLMLLDNELPGREADEIKSTIEKERLLKKEWKLLEQTRLEAGVFEMPNKQSLYYSEKNRRPVPIQLIRWMAAAAVVAGLGWYGFIAWNSTEVLPGKPDGIAVVPSPRVAPSPSNPTGNKVNSVTEEKSSLDQPEPSSSLAANLVSQTTSTDQDKNINNGQDARTSTASSSRQDGQRDMLKNLNPVELSPAAVAAIKPKQELTNSQPSVKVGAIEEPSLPQLAVNNQAEPSLVQQAAYHEDPFMHDNDEYVTIAGARIKKQKLRGVFRNVTRTITRTFDKSNIAQADYASLK